MIPEGKQGEDTESKPVTPISLEKLLLVEGETPKHFFEALLRHLGIDEQIEIRSFRGINDLPDFLKALPGVSEFRHVNTFAVIRDAEADARAARQSVDDALAPSGLTQQSGLRIEVFILPDNQRPGMLETLCMEAVGASPQLDGANACVEQFFECLESRGVTLPPDHRLAKHRAQAYLATREKVQLYPGTAAYKGYWPWNSRVFDPLKGFLRSL